jgi:hypothetical protein
MIHLQRINVVMAGLVPAISLRLALCIPKRDARYKAGHDSIEFVRSNSGQTLRMTVRGGSI